MSENNVFTTSNMNLKSREFGLKLLVPCTRIKENEFKDFFRRLKALYPKKFTTVMVNSDENIWVITNNQGTSRITLTDSSAAYVELKKAKDYVFRGIATTIYNFYIEDKEVPLSDFKLVGLVHNYNVKVPGQAIKFLSQNLKIFSKENLSAMELRTIMVENEMNIHVKLEAREVDPEEDEIDEHTLFITLDINNHDQVSGIKNDTFDTVFSFAEKYNQSRFLKLLNEYLTNEK